MNDMNGFTLMEILVAVAILALLGLATAGVVQNTFNAKTSAERDMEAIDIGRGVLRIISRDFSLAFHRPKYSVPVVTKVGGQIPQQKEDNMPTVFVGRNIDPFDEVNFTTLSHRRLYMDSNESEQAEVGYYVDPSPVDDNNMILFRRLSKRINEDPLEGGVVEKIAENVAYLSFRYWDCLNEKFVDDWDSIDSIDYRGKFPEAVEIRLGLDDFKGGVKSFETTVQITMPNNIERIRSSQAKAVDAAQLTISQQNVCNKCKAEKARCPDYCPKDEGEKNLKLLTNPPQGSCTQ